MAQLLTYLLLGIIISIIHLFAIIKKDDQLAMNQGLLVSIVIMLIFITSPFYVEYNGEAIIDIKNNRVITFDKDGQAIAHKYFALCLSNCSNTPVALNLVSKVQPITENPKVRQLTYEIDIEVKYVNKFFNTIGKKPHNNLIPGKEENEKIIKDTVMYHLYNFNEKYSKQLAKFYNPLDPEQKKKLEMMLMEYINPKITKCGLSVEKLIKFDVM